MSQIKRVAQNTGKSKKVARKGLKVFQKSRKRMLRSLDKTRSGGWADEKGKATRWGFHIPGNAYSYKTNGKYTSKKAATEAIKESYKIKRLPKGFEIWKD
jgi:hypothetical protein